MEGRSIDRVRIALSRKTVNLPWESRQALLGQCRHLDSLSGVCKAFDEVGTSVPVRLTREQKGALIEVIEMWGSGLTEGSPAGCPRASSTCATRCTTTSTTPPTSNAHARVPVVIAAAMTGHSPAVYSEHYAKPFRDAEERENVRKSLMAIGFGNGVVDQELTRGASESSA